MSSNKHAIKISESRFSILDDNDDDTSDNDDKSKDFEKNNITNTVKNAKKKARKKKKAAAEHISTNEIRNLAFTKPVSAKAIQTFHQLHHSQSPNPAVITKPAIVSIDNVNPDWEYWKEKDKEFVVDQFQKDLQTALHLSEIEIQNIKPVPMKAKKKNKTMSLDEFSNISFTTETPLKQPLPTRTILNGYCPVEVDPHYFEREIIQAPEVVQAPDQTSINTTNNTNKKKKNKKPAHVASVLPDLHFEEKIEDKNDVPSIDKTLYDFLRNELHTKDEEIARLNNTIETFKEELNEVKRRNKQLCFILGEGEMKEKYEILLQVEQLTVVKNELSEQLAEMHVALEQERSKVSALKSEVNKYQTSRTKTKSICEEK
ncbi:G kinase-anchoring protein 1 isoform X2 [Hydra vulgaris]|uniref:G kinase-anchoring protein 1 isoform X2 n=1 Tax=Hydra vulgaris TaxID=6087 RepID=A0ABM4D9U7_HYDVU